jgi:hypothetical protein
VLSSDGTRHRRRRFAACFCFGDAIFIRFTHWNDPCREYFVQRFF